MGTKKRERAPRTNPLKSTERVGSETDPKLNWKHLLIIFLVCLSVYSNTFFMGFVWDDLYQIQENLRIRSLENIPSFFTSEVWSGVKGQRVTPYYRPLFTLSLAADYFFWGEKPAGYHLTNILLHAAASILVYCMTLLIIRAGIPALLAGLIFAVHPVHAEAVAWISGRAESLAALFMFSSLYLYFYYKKKKRATYIALSFLFFFLALLSKETAITLPLIILIYEWCFGERQIKRKILWPVLYGLAILPYLLLRSLLLAITHWGHDPVSWRIYTGFGLVLEYVRLLILPFHLKVFYDIIIKKAFSVSDVLIPLLLVGGIFALTFLVRRYDRRLFFSILWVFITLLPVSGIYTLIHPSPMAERYLYIPSAGLSMAAAVLFLLLMNRVTEEKTVSEHHGSGQFLTKVFRVAPRLSQFFIVALIIIPIFILNFVRNRVWSDQNHFVMQRVEDAPNYPGSHFDVGLMFLKQDQVDNAAIEFRKALALDPDYAEARDSLGLIYLKRGQLNEAAKELQSAISIEPRFGGAHINLGIVYGREGKINDAEREFQIALKIDPDDTEALNNLAALHTDQGVLDAATGEFRKALKTGDDTYTVHYNLGIVHMNGGKLHDAVDEFRISLRLKPDFPEAHNNLASVYLKLRRNDDAEREFRTALRYRPDDPVIMNNLGVVCLDTGKIGEAITLIKEAVRRSPDNVTFKKSLDRAYELRNKRSAESAQ